ncbi:hypothetical protein ONE63_003865 [Megalurothrips usitatus]|uniref:Uncharacterized protein n=1 Tax=Megalurothrips usitatus TaxID=439358 RepID=A0AAV7XBB2_9NEOP|nr:hypothetical protein ONE63_003865 [Megalurothrips usitatus]
MQDNSAELLAEVEQRGININELVDQIIVTTREALILAKEDTVVLPDFAEDFYQKIWPFIVHGHLNCTKGSLRSLSSVRRTGDAKMAYKEGKLIVEAPLGLSELIVNYKYDASILHLGATGDLTANVTANSITLALEVSLTMTGCKLKMEEVKITNFGPIIVNLTGLYPFDGLSSAIAEKAADSLHDTIKQAAQKIIEQQLQDVIDKIPCHLPHWLHDKDLQKTKF